MNRYWKFLLYCISFTLFACSGVVDKPIYQPKIQLEKSSFLLNRKILVKTKINKLSKDIQLNDILAKPFLSGILEDQINSEIEKDLISNQLFSEIVKENPDYILNFEFNKFYSGIHSTKFASATAIVFLGSLPFLGAKSFIVFLSWYLGIPIDKRKIEMELICTITNKNKEVIGVYKEDYKQIQRNSIYRSQMNKLKLPYETNQILSNVLLSIREQIIVDSLKYNK
jgi:hypothetical protein